MLKFGLWISIAAAICLIEFRSNLFYTSSQDRGLASLNGRRFSLRWLTASPLRSSNPLQVVSTRLPAILPSPSWCDDVWEGGAGNGSYDPTLTGARGNIEVLGRNHPVPDIMR